MLEVKNVRLYPRPDQSETQGRGQPCLLVSPLRGMLVYTAKFETPLPNEYTHIFCAVYRDNTSSSYSVLKWGEEGLGIPPTVSVTLVSDSWFFPSIYATTVLSSRVPPILPICSWADNINYELAQYFIELALRSWLPLQLSKNYLDYLFFFSIYFRIMQKILYSFES